MSQLSFRTSLRSEVLRGLLSFFSFEGSNGALGPSSKEVLTPDAYHVRPPALWTADLQTLVFQFEFDTPAPSWPLRFRTLFRAFAQSTVPPCVWQRPVRLRRGPQRLPVVRRPTTLPQPGASVAFVPHVNQVIQENQENQVNQADVVMAAVGDVLGESPFVLPPPSLVGKNVPPPSPRKEDRLPDPPVVLEMICQSVPPFDSVLFRRSSAAQRSTREFLLEGARLARPQVNFNWRRLSKIFPAFKSVEELAKAAELFHRNGHLPREELLTFVTDMLSRNLDAAGC